MAKKSHIKVRMVPESKPDANLCLIKKPQKVKGER